MKIQLSDHFSLPRLLRFTLPSIVMMVFTSIYVVVDGFFVANYVGKTPFAALNFIMPVLILLGTVGFMFGTGGSALVSKTLGEKDPEKANRLFSLFVYVPLVLGTVLGGIAVALMPAIARALGAEGEMLAGCVLYGRIIAAATPAYIMQMEFQSFFVTAERPTLGLVTTVAAGVTNMVLDWLFMAVFRWGLAGAAIATAISQAVGALLPLVYFLRPNSSLLRLGRTRWDGKALFKACTNGSSELMSNVSMSLVGMLYNIQLIRYAGEDGVAAYGVLMYVNMIFLAIFIGYSVGTAPIVGYHFGARNHPELHSLLRKSLLLLSITAVGMWVLGEVSGEILSRIFVSYDAALLDMTRQAFTIFSFSFLFAGFNIYASSFFTALNDGLISAMISFLRTLVFQTAAVLLLPRLWGLNGIWWSIVVAEGGAFLVSGACVLLLRKKYQY